MNKTIFREKSLARVNSPEDLDHYIQATQPVLWVVLLAIILLFGGAFLWAGSAKIDDAIAAGISVENKQYTVYFSEASYEKLQMIIAEKKDPLVRIDDQEVPLQEIIGPFECGEEGTYLFHVSGLNEGEWYYASKGNIDLPDGEYKGQLIFERISPLVFIFN